MVVELKSVFNIRPKDPWLDFYGAKSHDIKISTNKLEAFVHINSIHNIISWMYCVEPARRHSETLSA